MKTNFFRKNASVKAGRLVRRFLASLGMTVLLLSPVLLSAQPGVKITGLAVEAGTVTLDVRWEPLAPPTVWSDTVWVFVDHNAGGIMKRLPLTGATLTNPSAAATATVPLPNNKGAWVAGNARIAGSFSAKVKLYYDSQTAVAGACAYASNYPPVAEYATASSITFTGTPPFDLVLSPGGQISVQKGYELVGSQTLASFTDKTGAPGVITPLTYTLIASASGFCEGATNGVSFALQGTQKDVKYQLYNGATLVGNELSGTGSAATFSGTFNTAGTYTARTVAEGAYQATPMSGSHPIKSNKLPAQPIIAKPADVCQNVENIVFTATDYSGSLTWTSYTGGTQSGNSVTFASADTGTKTVKAQSSQTYSNAPTCYSATVTQSATVNLCCDAPGATVNFTAFDPCPNAASGSTWTLRDTRAGGNNNTYIVKLMKDGRYWMVQDLLFGSCATSTATWRDDISSGTPRIQPTVYADASTTYVGHCRQATVSASAKTVNLYNWAGAMNNANGFCTSSDATFECTGRSAGTYGAKYPANCRGICPEGWHIPTGGAAGEFQDLFETLEGGTGSSSTELKVRTNFGFNSTTITYDTNEQHWHGVLGGYCASSSGVLYTQGSSANYWSSTRAGYCTSYYLYYNALAVSPQCSTVEYDYTGSTGGYSVRCVRNY